MGGPTQYGAGNGPAGAPGPMPPQQPPVYGPNGFYGGPVPKRRGWVPGAAAAIAGLLGVAALVISLIGLSRDSKEAATSTSPATVATSSQSPEATEAADRALCTAIAPLVKENLARGKEFVALGDPGTAARDAGIDGFMADTLNWVKRIEAPLTAHNDASPYFIRTLQRFIDDRRIYSTNIRPGPETPADRAAWDDSKVALAGPYEVCGNLDIPLW
jgi:hypothetical protein